MEALPKQTKKPSKFKQNDWYSYYAGYSDEFVYEYLKESIGKEYVLLDPWNGAGTTTLCCSLLGIECVGIDINPAMNVIAYAKCFQPTLKFTEKLEGALNSDTNDRRFRNDPLEVWFTDETVSMIRNVQNSLCRAFNINKLGNGSTIDIASLSCESAYVLLLQLLSIRDNSQSFVGSNPTWIKVRNIKKVSISKEEWTKSIRKHALETASKCSKTNNQIIPRILIGDSRKIPLPNNSVNIVLTSPPYCTRIDYAIYTQLELALLGIQNDEVKKLRNHMIGSPTVHKDVLKGEVSSELVKCNKLLDEIRKHDSKAAQSYYYKTYKQYILEMEASLKEIARVLVIEGIAILVIQDSWFKDIHVDVPGIVVEIAAQFNLKGKIQYYHVKQNIAYINTKSRKYKKTKKASEAIIEFRKGTI